MLHHSPARVSRRAVLGTALALPTAAALAACGDGTPSTGTDTTPTKITYLTNFGVFGRDAYAWLGQTAGHFADHGLEVEIQPGTGTEGNLAALIGGTADFAAIDLAGAAMVHGAIDGATGYVAIAAIHQLPLATVMGRASDIQRPADLAGAKIGITPGAITELLLDPWADLAGVDPHSFERVPMGGPDLIPALVTRDVDAICQFIPGLPTVENAVGEDIIVFPYSDYIDDLYGVGLFTRADLAAENPDLCIRARDAFVAALTHALDDPAAAGAALEAAVPETSAEGAAAELEVMAPYCRTTGVPVGALDEVRMSQHLALLEALGLSQLGAHESGEIVAWDLTLSPAAR